MSRQLAFAVAAVLLGVVSLWGWPGFRAYLRSMTGEESLYEGAKGIVALALIEARSPALDLEPYAPAENLDVNGYGVNTFLQLEADPANVERTFKMLGEADIGWARQEFPWEDIEIHGAGDFQDRRQEPWRSAWDKYDRIVAAAADHGVRLLVRLDNPPDWAFADPAASGEKGPPDDLDDFGRFAAVVAERYCGRVADYQIWNEPNIYPEWGERDVDPAGYADLLRVGAAAVRDACPEVQVVSAALAPTTEPGGRNMNDLAYLRALYAADWSDSFDILGAQGFGLWTGPTDRRTSPDRANFSRVLLDRDIMVQHGDAAKPVWITEMGWNSPPADLDVPDRGKYGVTSEAQRAAYLVGAFERMQAEWPWAGVGFVWMFRRPDWEWHTRPEGYFRLVEPNWQTTPSFDALRKLSQAPTVLHWGRHLPTDPAFVYSGPWRDAVGEDGPVKVGTVGAEVAFGFRGAAFELRVDERSETEPLQVFLVLDGDSEEVEPVSQDGEALVRRAGLDTAAHMAIARVDAGELRLRQVRVEDGQARPRWWPFVVALAVGCAWVGLGLAASMAAILRRR